MEPGVFMATQNFKRNLLILYREGKKNLTLVVCFLLPLRREIKKKCLTLATSVWRPLAFLPVTLSFPPFLLGELCCQGKRASFSFHNYFLLFRGVVPKLLRQHILLTLILRVSDPGAPSNSWRKLWHS